MGESKFETLDNDTRREFSTGSMREEKTEKTRPDLIPIYPLRMLADLYARGARKYAPWNWLKGQPLSEYRQSAWRHWLDLWDGKTDEDHLSAVVWNLFSYAWTKRAIESGKLPAELNDLEDQSD